jgi:hypothetical protein
MKPPEAFGEPRASSHSLQLQRRKRCPSLPNPTDPQTGKYPLASSLNDQADLTGRVVCLAERPSSLRTLSAFAAVSFSGVSPRPVPR